MIDAEKFQTMERVAEKLFRAGVFSAEVKSADTAFAIILAGDEMGYEPMAAARALALVKGKVSLSADAMVGLVKRSTRCESWHVVETSAAECTITTRRVGDDSPTTLTYTIAMAQRAGLTGSQTWRAHPEAMLRARCGAALARAVYPDVCGGLYDPDEADEIRGRSVEPKASAKRSEPQPEAVEAAPVPACPPALAAFYEALPELTNVDGAAALWHEHRAALNAAEGHARPTAWDALVARAMTLGAGVASATAAKNALKARLAALSSKADAPAAASEAPVEAAPAAEPVAVPFAEQLARCTTLDGVAGLWIAARADIAQGSKADQAAAWGAAVERLAVIQHCEPTKAVAMLLTKRIASMSDDKPDPNGPKGTLSREASAPVDAHGRSEATNDAMGATMSTAARWRAHLVAKPRTGKLSGAGAVAASWVKHREELTEAGARAECLAITIDELAARGVTEPGAWIDGVREHRLAKAA